MSFSESRCAGTSISTFYFHAVPDCTGHVPEVCTGAAIIPVGERLVPSWPGAFQKQHGKLGNPLQPGMAGTSLLEDP